MKISVANIQSEEDRAKAIDLFSSLTDEPLEAVYEVTTKSLTMELDDDAANAMSNIEDHLNDAGYQPKEIAVTLTL